MRLFLLIIGFVSLIPLAATAQSEPMFSGVETRLTTDPLNQIAPAISGNWVVYTDYRALDADVGYVDILTGEEHQVSVQPGDQMLTDISNGRIVYTDYTGQILCSSTLRTVQLRILQHQQVQSQIVLL
jgi:beta propeller repeat protein